jgi:hypothetical protein
VYCQAKEKFLLELCEVIFDRRVQVTQEEIPVELRLTITDVHKAFCAEALIMEAQKKDEGLKNRVSHYLCTSCIPSQC